MKKQCSLFLTAFLAAVCCHAAIILDGNLNEPEWQNLSIHTGFVKMERDLNKVVDAQTEFKILCQDDKIYFGVKCHEPLMQKLRTMPPGGMWATDGIEIFLAPSGYSTEFYQFLVTYTNFTYSMYYAESGNIRPDPFAPVWSSAIYSGEDFWSAEIEFPLDTFYMTRQHSWNSNWLVNIGRSRCVQRERSSWSQLDKSFLESSAFRKLGGFPMRAPGNDVYISTASSEITGMKGEQPTGNMVVTFSTPIAGKYTLNGNEITAKAGINKVKIPYTFEQSGRNKVQLVLTRQSDKQVFQRYYQVHASFEPLKIELTTPAYRNNFYPGQKADKIAGVVKRNGTGTVTVTLSGSGIDTQKVTLDQALEFSFDVPDFPIGEATLTASMGTYTETAKVKRLAPIERTMAWIENGNIIVNGKPVYRRNPYAEYYRGGTAFKEKYDNDELFITKHIKGAGGWVEPARLIPGIEAREATKDVRPCDEYFKRLDATIEKSKDRDFVYYYISDEPECRGVSPIYLQHIYEYLKEKDPYHIVLCGSRSCGRYLNCADWFDTHPYINPYIDENGKRTYDRPISSIGAYLDEISTLNRPDKVIGFMPTMFCSKYSFDASQYPNFEEMVCHTYVAINHGCRSLFPYAYHDLGDRASLYEGIRYIFESIEYIQDFLMFGQRNMLLTNQNCEAVLWQLGKEQMFTVVNMTQQPQQLTVEGLKGTFKEFRGDRTFSSFAFNLQPLEVIIGTTNDAGKGLKSFQTVKAEIEKLDAARAQRGNILFERQLEIEVAASKPVGSCYKMVDGVTDMLAWTDPFSKNKYYEMAFPKFVPAFSKVRIFGHNIDNTQVKIRKRGQWKTLEPKNTVKETYMVEYDFGETLTTVKIRFEFPLSRVELYEIELLK